MRKLDRIRTEGIPKAFRGTDREKTLLKLLKAEQNVVLGDIEKHEFNSTWSPCKEQLHKESNEKCAYCESTTTIVSYGDVEHYRPKSKYWWLAYCYDNYLASCTLCNQKYKKAKFEILNSKMIGPEVTAENTVDELEEIAKGIIPDPFDPNLGLDRNDFIEAHKKERPLLINPYIDDPKDFFIWKPEHGPGLIKLAALDENNDLHLKILEASKNDFGINRLELCRHRYDTYLVYCSARLILEDTTLPSRIRSMNQIVLNRVRDISSAYVGMIEFFDKMSTTDLSLPS